MVLSCGTCESDGLFKTVSITLKRGCPFDMFYILTTKMCIMTTCTFCQVQINYFFVRTVGQNCIAMMGLEPVTQRIRSTTDNM